MMLFISVSLSAHHVACVRVNTVQLQLGGCFSELHVDPAMGMAFAKVIADCGLIDQMKVIHLVMLPLMGVAIKISLGMLSLGENFQ